MIVPYKFPLHLFKPKPKLEYNKLLKTLIEQNKIGIMQNELLEYVNACKSEQNPDCLLFIFSILLLLYEKQTYDDTLYKEGLEFLLEYYPLVETESISSELMVKC